MKHILFCIALLSSLPEVSAQGIALIKNGHGDELVSIYFSPYEYYFYSASYIKKEGIQEMMYERFARKQKGGKPALYKSVVQYDSTGRDTGRHFWRKGKLTNVHTSHTTFTPVGENTLSEWRGKHNKFLSRSLTTWDSIARKSTWAYQNSENAPFLLRNESEYTAYKRLLRQQSYNKKGQPDTRWEYTYHDQSPEELKRIEQYNRKGKRIHIREYTCSTPSVAAKHVVQDCKRTDKDPMGNRLEIEEFQQGKNRFTVIATYNLQNKLIAVEMKDHKERVIKKGVNEYDKDGNLTVAKLFVKNMKMPRAEKHYVYENGKIHRVVFFEKGKQKHITVYRLRYFHENL